MEDRKINRQHNNVSTNEKWKLIRLSCSTSFVSFRYISGNTVSLLLFNINNRSNKVNLRPFWLYFLLQILNIYHIHFYLLGRSFFYYHLKWVKRHETFCAYLGHLYVLEM